MITTIRSICDEYSTVTDSPSTAVYAFPTGIPFTFWEQYLNLRRNLLYALGVTMAAVFVVVSVLLMSPWSAVIVVVTLAIMVVEMAGFMGLFGLKLNAISAVSVITAVGIGVEFTVHVS